uniref:Uncharacterized protein n=1 Tax=Oryza brachyantha TaxID=4533 RepID=J3L0J7_ORYBR
MASALEDDVGSECWGGSYTPDADVSESETSGNCSTYLQQLLHFDHHHSPLRLLPTPPPSSSLPSSPPNSGSFFLPLYLDFTHTRGLVPSA